MLISIDDVLKQISKSELIELTDLNNTKELDIVVFNDALDEAISYINTIIRIPNKSSDISYSLKKIIIDEVIYNLRDKNSLITKSSIEQRDQNIDKLKDIALSQNFNSNSNFHFKHKKRLRD